MRFPRGFFVLALTVFASLRMQAQDTLVKEPIFTLDELQRQQDQQLSPHALVYRNAYAIGDWQTAATAAHYLLLEQPENHFLEDSIATYYLRAGNLQACKAWSEKCLAKRPQSGQLHYLLAQIHESEGNLTEALKHYEALAVATDQLYFHYQVAALQLKLQRYGECRAKAEALLAKPENGDAISIASATGADVVSMHAAAWNLLGVLERELKNEKAAKAAFKRALELDPEFRLAKENLRYRPAPAVQETGGGN
jgi:tetratricopeptide (TPR) repeat protein